MHNNAFEDSVLKDGSRYYIRRRILDQFPKSKGLSAFTLPGKAFAFEEDLHSDFKDGLSLTGVEQDRTIFDEGYLKLKSLGLPMKLWRKNDLKHWSKIAEETYDFVWLDYCAQWTAHQRDAIYSMVKNGHLSFDRGNPLVALTVGAAREPKGKAQELRASSDEENLMDARRVGIPRIINQTVGPLGVTFIPQFVMYYKDSVRNRKSRAMLLFVFEVFKGSVKFDEGKVPFMYSKAELSRDVDTH